MLQLHTWATLDGRKISIMPEELGVPYELCPVNIAKDEQLKPEYVALNQNSKIPVLVDPEGPEGAPITLAALPTSRFTRGRPERAS
ncbi:glutathione S-transferase N-terminal domain-containing protein [Acidisoma cellulosilytica]|uniref:Glutathione S-transferase N-terminal domain-containing protein n=1 Tax=Acidisoma cellulosilyticum TaxID=2802395 RepID=A0A964E604_9PROT|nr:glutathione S-transferase N-terminal domain-containing protein [Acidisoma cellulosilyticum]MCB8882992.1 glutathione S-transferase N-terminal domain-containing protein [Acidisoma cellulosilyticum]